MYLEIGRKSLIEVWAKAPIKDVLT